MAALDIRTYEVTFCSRVAGWLNSLFDQHPNWPFRRAEIEEPQAIHRKRSDLRVYGDAARLILAGEVKMPGTAQGWTPYNSEVVEDSAQKADNMGAEFFFTWNVNLFVLFDRKKWHLPILERRVQEFPLGTDIPGAADVDRPEVESRLQGFLADFFGRFAAIAAGQQPDWGMRLDDWFIRAFEHHVSWPVKLTADFLWEKSNADKNCDQRLQEWLGKEQGWQFVRSDPSQWRDILDRAARTLCYVFANRLIFYESCRAKFSEQLTALSIPKTVSSADHLYDHFQKTFQEAVEATGDYETLFYPYERDWAGPLIFGHADSAGAWRSVLQNLEPFNFKLIPTDILGGIFRRIIDPEERHKFGQHYTNEDLVDVVNAFCIRRAEDHVLDPACGSGSFLVRAYQRKAWLKQDQRRTHPGVAHQDRLAQIYGVDISLFAAHLSTLNLAARDIEDEENYPRVRRGNFFEVADEVAKGKPFCQLPQGLQGERSLGPVLLPPLQAIVGNPPYVRQELIPTRQEKGVKPMSAKEDLLEFCAQAWPGLKLSGRSDLHCYFWPAATRFLANHGWFGFLVSSSWLDVEYGFALQEWALNNFRLQAILESNAEPWFEDARVKTCAVILQRCEDPAARHAQLVRFVRLDTPLAAILGKRTDENARQTAAEAFREAIFACKKNTVRDGWRVVVKRQKELWDDGIRAGRLFAMQRQRDLADNLKPQAAEQNDEEAENGSYDEHGNGLLHETAAVYGAQYGGGKWGKYLRAPNLYFRIMERYGTRFVPLGEIAKVRRGITSGCDAFFMPRDVSADFLARYSQLEWNNAPIMTYCERKEVVSRKVKLIEAGDGTVHPVEAKYLSPEVHSLMNVTRPKLSAAELDRLVLQVAEPMEVLRGTYVQKYLRYGEKTTFASKKSKAVPVPMRSTCVARNPWYDLTYTKRGHLIWSKSQQYRHVVVLNENKLIVNCNLYDVSVVEQDDCPPELLAAVLNSTLVGLTKFYFGRFAGTEGNLKTEIVDVNLLEVPDPRRVTKTVSMKLRDAFTKLCQRDTRPMVEEEFMDCHSAARAKKLAEKPLALPTELQMKDRRALDLAVFELLGVATAKEREALCEELYRETAAHFRQIRVVEIQKQEQRGAATGREFRTDELAGDLWDALAAEDRQPLAEWLAVQTRGGQPFLIPEGQTSLPGANDMLDANTVFFRQSSGGKSTTESLPLPSRSHAEIVFALSRLGMHGSVRLPETAHAATILQQQIDARLAAIADKATHLARSRTSDERKAADVAGLLQHWMIHGKPRRELEPRSAAEKAST